MDEQRGNSRKRIFKEKYNDRFLLRLVCSYSFLLVIILILGLIMYYYSINNVKKDLLKENQVNLEKAVNDVDNSFKIMSSINSQISNNVEIVKLMHNNTTDHNYYLQAWDAKKSLQNLLSIQNMTFFEDVFLYFYETDYVLSANEFEKSILYYQYNKRYKKEFYQEYLAVLTDMSAYGKPQSLKRYTDVRDDFLLYTYPMSIYRNYTKAPVTICYRINKNYFKDLFAGINTYDTGFLSITDSSGSEIFRLATSASAETAILETSKLLKENKNTGYVTLNHEKMLITRVSSNNNLWSYYLVQPSTMVFHNLAFIQRIYWVAIILVLVIGLILLVLLSWKNLKPIKQLESRLMNSFSGEEGTVKVKERDVIYSIDHYVNLLIDKKITLQETLEHQRPIIFSAYLSRLMKGLSDTPIETEQIAKVLNLNNENSNYMVLYLGVYLNELEFYIDDFTQNKNSFQELIKEVLERNFEDRVLLYEADFQSYAVLIQMNSEAEGAGNKCADTAFYDRARLQFHKAYRELKDAFSLVIYGGISETFTNLYQTWQASQHAMEALRYAGPEHILQLYHEINKDMDQYSYTIEMESQLLQFITNGKENQMLSLLKNIYLENFVERSLSITMSKWLLSDIRNTLLKIRFMLPNKFELEKLSALDEKFNQKKSFELIEDIARELCQIFVLRQRQQGLIEKIQDYIQENYSDSTLSLSKISQEFNISESYFSLQFKKVTNQNFSEYLENIRIQQAVKLLQGTDMNVNDIAEKTGYTNCVSFRRAFKRVIGTNPAALRTQPDFTEIPFGFEPFEQPQSLV